MASSEQANKKKPVTNPYYLDGTNFDPDLYMQYTFKTSNLRQLMSFENEIVQETMTLHSDMQTLVYENYNKFISATDTVKKMKTDFKKMEDEMELLASNMESITTFSESISSILQDSHHQISKLSGIHSLLKRLQFLFKLPNKLKTQMQYKNYYQAVQDYLHIQRVLEQYGNLESFQGIQQECNDILEELKKSLREQFSSKYVTTKELAESFDLLIQLKEPPSTLCNDYFVHAESRLTDKLKEYAETSYQDLLEYASVSNKFIDDLCLVICCYNDMFLNRTNVVIENASSMLSTFTTRILKQYFDQIQSYIELLQESGETEMLGHSLDKYYRKLNIVRSLVGDSDYLEIFMDLIIRSGRRQCRYQLHVLKSYLSESLLRVRESLVSPKLIGSSSEVSSSGLTAELLTQLVSSLVEKVKMVLEELLPFAQSSSLTFSSRRRFREAFCIDSVREGLVVGFIHHLTATARSFTANTAHTPSLPLLLILSKMCLEFEVTNVHYLLRLTDKLFEMGRKEETSLLTTEEEMCAGMRIAAQNLLNHYVRLQGLAVSQMLRKSVETRDWLHSLEPRTVRAVMKRVMEEIAAIETQVGLLFEEGSRPERSSDSSRKTHSRQHRSTASNWSSHSLAVSHIHKLFSEKIEIMAPVEFSKVSILTGIIKISLKTLLECVRLRTFSRYGLQQIQVDTHYLQLYLWRFVSDENIVNFFLDEILSSSINRCLDAVLMEPSVVEIICERG